MNQLNKDGILPGCQGFRVEAAEEKSPQQKKHAQLCHLLKLKYPIFSILLWHRGSHSSFCRSILVFLAAMGVAIPWQYRGTPGNWSILLYILLIH